MLPQKVVAVSTALHDAGIPHAFGGAIALAYCVADARGTVDMDVNIFLGAEDVHRVLAALPDGVAWRDEDVRLIEEVGQTRVLWDDTPVDLFFNTTPFHRDVALRARAEPFGPVQLPVLACRDLAVFKAFFDRTKDWADLEAMAAAGVLDIAHVCGVLVEHLGADDPRVARVRALGGEPGGAAPDVAGRHRA